SQSIMDNFRTGTAHHTPQNLLGCFFAACEKAFRFLEQEHGFTYLSGLTEYRMGRRIFTPWNPRITVSSAFTAATLYEKDNISIEIFFQGESSTLDFHFCYTPPHRFEFAEIINAPRLLPANAPEMPPLASEQQLEKIMEDMSGL